MKLAEFEIILKNERIQRIDDSVYRETVFNELFHHNKNLPTNYSIVDFILREMLKDINLKLDYLITFNKSDFEDICQIRQIEIYP